MINSDLLNGLGREGELLGYAVSDILNAIMSGEYEIVVEAPSTSFSVSSFKATFDNYARGLINAGILKSAFSLYDAMPIDPIGIASLSLPHHANLPSTDPSRIESIYRHVVLSEMTLDLAVQLSRNLFSLPDTGHNNAIISGVNEFLNAMSDELFSGSINNLYARPHFFSNPTADMFKLLAIDELLYLATSEISFLVEELMV